MRKLPTPAPPNMPKPVPSPPPPEPTSQQVPEVEPLSAQNMAEILRISRAHVPLTTRSISSRRIFDRMAAIEDGHHVVISATELNKLLQHMGMEAPSERMMREINALRAREERLRELVVIMEKDTEGATPTLADLAIIYYRKLIESILNEGKTNG